MRRDIEKTKKRLIKKADAGDIDAMLDYCGLYPEHELQKATGDVRKRVLRYLRTAARRGNATALCNLGAAYYGGNCLVKSDFTKAVKYYEASAAKGCVQALCNLGYCHYYGRNIPVDYEKAFNCFLKAYILAPYEVTEACYKLGDCFKGGRGVPSDPVVAFELYGQAYRNCCSPDAGTFKAVLHGWDSRLSGADAALRLGDCYLNGIGCGQDAKRAVHFYRIAVAGFKRKVELSDCFAPGLLESAKKRLAEAQDARSKKRKRLGKHFELVCDVVGMRYVEDLGEKLRNVEIGDDVSLLRDPGNAHDANAIAVVAPDGERVGWIPRSCNCEAASRIDRGEDLAAVVIDVCKERGVESMMLSITN